MYKEQRSPWDKGFSVLLRVHPHTMPRTLFVPHVNIVESPGGSGDIDVNSPRSLDPRIRTRCMATFSHINEKHI